jgi:hypothetical protein
VRRALALVVVLAGCVSEKDVRQPLQEQLVVTGRIMGFALDADLEALHTKLELVEADPKLEAKLGSPEKIRQKIERIQEEKRSLEAELKALKDRYPVDGGEH